MASNDEDIALLIQNTQSILKKIQEKQQNTETSSSKNKDDKAKKQPKKKAPDQQPADQGKKAQQQKGNKAPTKDQPEPSFTEAPPYMQPNVGQRNSEGRGRGQDRGRGKSGRGRGGQQDQHRNSRHGSMQNLNDLPQDFHQMDLGTQQHGNNQFNSSRGRGHGNRGRGRGDRGGRGGAHPREAEHWHGGQGSRQGRPPSPMTPHSYPTPQGPPHHAINLGRPPLMPDPLLPPHMVEHGFQQYPPGQDGRMARDNSIHGSHPMQLQHPQQRMPQHVQHQQHEPHFLPQQHMQQQFMQQRQCNQAPPYQQRQPIMDAGRAGHRGRGGRGRGTGRGRQNLGQPGQNQKEARRRNCQKEKGQQHKKTAQTAEVESSTVDSDESRDVSETDSDSDDGASVTQDFVSLEQFTRLKTEEVESEDEEESDDGQPDLFNVGKQLLDTFKGQITFQEFSNTFFESNEDSAAKWVSENADKFVQIKNAKGEIKHLTVYSQKASVCTAVFKYTKCTKLECPYFHVCKEDIFGNCRFGNRCRNGHQILRGHRNQVVARSCGLDRLTNMEIQCLMRFSNLVVCEKGCASNFYVNCPRLHVCPKWVRDECDDPEQCKQLHDFKSIHSTQLIKQHNMQTWDEEEIKKRVIVPDSLLKPPKSTDKTLSNQPKPQNADEKETAAIDPKALKSTKANYNSDVPICEANLRGKCEVGQQCSEHHFSAPYLWQIKLFKSWTNLYDINKEIEGAFCCPDTDVQEFKLPKPIPGIGGQQSISIDFVKMSGDVQIQVVQSSQASLPNRHTFTDKPIRRLSTKSYVLAKVQETCATEWVWFWLNDANKWESYGVGTYLPIQYLLEENLNRGVVEFAQKMSNGLESVEYIFDMASRIQVNSETEKRRRMKRRPLLKSDTKEESTLPSHWSCMEPLRDFTTVSLPSDSREYQSVRDRFNMTMKGKATISDIIRVQNVYHWKKYCLSKEFLQKKLSSEKKVERILFHGTTSSANVTEICHGNFDSRVSGQHGSLYGKGSYFGTTAEYCNNYTDRSGRDDQFIFQARVLVGKYTEGQGTYTRPPKVSEDGQALYDSCVNDKNNPTIFVVFDLSQCYPEYIIVYKDNISKPMKKTAGMRVAYEPAAERENAMDILQPTVAAAAIEPRALSPGEEYRMMLAAHSPHPFVSYPDEESRPITREQSEASSDHMALSFRSDYEVLQHQAYAPMSYPQQASLRQPKSLDVESQREVKKKTHTKKPKAAEKECIVM